MFLSGKALDSKIKELIEKGENVKMVVAYIGDQADRFLRKKNNVKILCNFFSGGTNPSAIKTILEDTRNNVEVFDCPKLHSKVYICDEYAIVGSANLSTNGVDLEGVGYSKTIETAVLVHNKDDDYKGVSKWVENMFSEQKNKITLSSINFDYAILKYNKTKKRGGVHKECFLDDFVVKPEQYIFVFYNGSDADVKETKDQVKGHDINVRGHQKRLGSDGYFQEDIFGNEKEQELRDAVSGKKVVQIMIGNSGEELVFEKFKRFENFTIKGVEGILPDNSNIQIQKNKRNKCICVFTKKVERKGNEKLENIIFSKVKENQKDISKWLEDKRSGILRECWYIDGASLAKIIKI